LALLDRWRSRAPSSNTAPPLLEQNAHAAFNMSYADLLQLAKSYTWVHSIDLGGDYVTQGQWGRGNPAIASAFDTIDFKGKRVLDIGCWDGQWSFEAEARGASEVVATDLISQRDFTQQKTFQVAAALRGSNAIYIPDLSVYSAESLKKTFDIVLYMGIYYHLKDPLKAFTVLRRVLNDGGQLLVEGAILEQPGCFANFYYKQAFCGENSNWWVPTRDCLRQWVECSFFDIGWEGEHWGMGDNQRHCLVAHAVRRSDPLYSRTPEELEHFNLNNTRA
jgi:tRNA (mo5U34)-methyltransferase